MEIKVTINAPELETAILALADAIKSAGNTSSPKAEVMQVSNPKSDTLPVVTTKTELPVKESMTLTYIRAEISSMIKAGKLSNDDVRKKLEEYGVSKLTELSINNYESFYMGLIK